MTRAAALDSGVAASAVYSLPARVAHWLTAVLVIVAFFIGLTMLRVGQGELQNQLFDLHRSLGATILALAALRLLWRLWPSATALAAGDAQLDQGRRPGSATGCSMPSS